MLCVHVYEIHHYIILYNIIISFFLLDIGNVQLVQGAYSSFIISFYTNSYNRAYSDVSYLFWRYQYLFDDTCIHFILFLRCGTFKVSIWTSHHCDEALLFWGLLHQGWTQWSSFPDGTGHWRTGRKGPSECPRVRDHHEFRQSCG